MSERALTETFEVDGRSFVMILKDDMPIYVEQKCECSTVDQIVADNDWSKPVAERLERMCAEVCNACGRRSYAASDLA